MKGVTLYRPNTIENALNDFDRYFESFFGESPLSGTGRFLNRLPSVDVRETEKAYVLEMDLPGYNEKDIEVHLDGSSLTIESRQEKTTEEGKKEGAYILRERRINSFSRSFKLPQNADPEAVSAGFSNGVLCLEINKRAEAQKKVIQINKN
ncbi:MAG: Hsp20/alpha crystallin family protein [Treponema sp.]|jgi:HSP20 family protein|nr:Hsp20/alpha crystallin family protein [Treponema sp.]